MSVNDLNDVNEKINVVGAGLAGCEAAWQLASAGVPVRLFEMKPENTPPRTSTAASPSLCAQTR